jgi:ribosomal protein S12 methylthiotransferase accessory factor
VTALTAPESLSSLKLLESLVSPLGPITGIESAAGPPGLSRASACACSIGAPVTETAAEAVRSPVRCGGRAIDDADRARLLALAEAMERYSSGGFAAEPSVVAPIAAARSYGPTDAVLDPATVARCSERELADPNCPLGSYDPAAAIRWVSGVNLHDGVETQVPTVMAYHGCRGHLESERFWYRISTGCAVHFDPYEALFAALCEVIERDAVMVAWLQRMPLPLVPDDRLSATAAGIVDWAQARFMRTLLFDATTDLGVPTVLCVQTAEHDPRVRTVMSAGTGRNLGAAAEKAILEVVYLRNGLFREAGTMPENVAEIQALSDGARYMAHPERAAAFDFLISDAHSRSREPVPDLPADPRSAVSTVLLRLRRNGMRAFAVDRTRGEAAQIGLHSFAVVIPELQPMTTLPIAQYRAHPRLYALPASMGYAVHPEEELNPWPLPFA